IFCSFFRPVISPAAANAFITFACSVNKTPSSPHLELPFRGCSKVWLKCHIVEELRLSTDTPCVKRRSHHLLWEFVACFFSFLGKNHFSCVQEHLLTY